MPDFDPYRYHPELRSRITDPRTSYFRTFTVAVVAEKARELGLPQWWFSDEDREAMREEALRDNRETDLWVFAYGSLMWDPALEFAEVRRARAPGHVRRFILKDIFGARGTADAPGLMAALDTGAGCEGLAFRIARDRIEEETEILWRREQVGAAYQAAFVPVDLSDGPVTALTFVADHDAALIDATLSRDEQVCLAATGEGFLGTSLEYLRNIHEKFAVLGIKDDDVTSLLRDAEAFAARQAKAGG
jgi:glutathione-specific gamma-glutamylcyclotransferase